MKIIVCVKQVPDTDEVGLDPVNNTLLREGVPSIINPDDKAGIEAALTLKDRFGATVCALCMGPPQAEDAMREALAMGVDEAYLISDRALGGADTLATSSTLAAVIEKLGYDLVIAGRQSIDGETAQVGPQVAERLGIPNISYAEEIELKDGAVIAGQRLEGMRRVVRAKLPCLVTVFSGINKPRYMTLDGIFGVSEKRVSIITRADIDIPDHRVGAAGSATLVVDTYVRQPKGRGRTVKLPPDEAVTWLMENLREKHVV